MRHFIEKIEFEVLAGTDIEQAIDEAIDIANTRNVIVKFRFNGVDMSIWKQSDKKGEYDYYMKELKRDK